MKITRFIILSLVLMLTSSCAKYSTVNTSEQNDNIKLKSTAQNNTESSDGNFEIESETVINDFFFKDNVSQINFKGSFMFNSIAQKDVKLHVEEVAKLKLGKLYLLKLDSIEGIPNDRLSLGYFYVQKDKIYRIKPTKNNLNKLKSNQGIPDESAIVCCDKEIKDSVGKDESGWHQYIDVIDDIREYHSYNNQGETGYYESFTWEKNKGLIFYQSGFGAEKDSIKIQLSNESDTNNYTSSKTVTQSTSDTSQKTNFQRYTIDDVKKAFDGENDGFKYYYDGFNNNTKRYMVSTDAAGHAASYHYEVDLITGDIFNENNQLLGNMDKMIKAPNSKSLESWVGNYSYSEFVPPNQNMFYVISVFNENGNYYANINIDGFQTNKRLKAKIEGNENSINFIFEKSMLENGYELYKVGDILMSFNIKNKEIATSWGKITPIDKVNMASDNIYFKKEK